MPADSLASIIIGPPNSHGNASLDFKGGSYSFHRETGWVWRVDMLRAPIGTDGTDSRENPESRARYTERIESTANVLTVVPNRAVTTRHHRATTKDWHKILVTPGGWVTFDEDEEDDDDSEVVPYLTEASSGVQSFHHTNQAALGSTVSIVLPKQE